MKSATITAAVLASVAIAQPHGHHRRHQHEKRDVVVEWETVWETATVIIEDSTTETILPSNTAGQFFQAVTTSSTSTAVTVPTTTSTAVTVPTTTSTAVTVPTTTSIAAVKATTPVPVVVVPTTTSTTPVVVPTTTAVVVAAPQSTTTAAAPAETTTASSNTGSTTGTNTKSGKMTYYAPGLGSCGFDDSGTDNTKNIVAVDISFFQSISSLTSYGIDQPANPLCNQEITISYGGATTTGVIRDACPGCGFMGLDVTEKAFKELSGGSLDAGHLPITWWFNSGKY